jgi:hypothetical protein
MEPPCAQIFYGLDQSVHRELVRSLTFRPLALALIAVAAFALL